MLAIAKEKLYGATDKGLQNAVCSIMFNYVCLKVIENPIAGLGQL